MTTSTLAAILITVTLAAGSILAFGFRTPPERRAVEDQIHMVIPGPIVWDRFTKAGSQPSVMGGTVDIWDADFTVSGHHMQMRYLAYHHDGQIRMVPIQ